MKMLIVSLMLLASTFTSSFGQNNAAAIINQNNALKQRAAKIVAPLALTDSARYHRVLNVVVGQYEALAVIQESQEKQLAETAKETDKSVQAARRKSIDDATTDKLKVQHTEYLGKLSKDLNEKQIAAIKDGMTYHVLEVTVKAYNDMIPSLKPAEKTKILDWLTEARELAMDAGSSKAKHAVFGKYKGKINNYLAAQGYDLQKERKQWEERQKEGKR